MSPDFLNNLYLVGGLITAMFVIVWRFSAADRKLVQQTVAVLQLQIQGVDESLRLQIQGVNNSLQLQIQGVDESLRLQIQGVNENLQLQLQGVYDRLTKIENRLDKLEDQVRRLQLDMAVVKDRLNISAEDFAAAAAVPAPA